MTNLPTQEEIEKTSEVLRRLPRGFLPLPIFLALAEKIVLPTLELAPLRLNKIGTLEVLLTRRPADDPYWPNGWHIPGSVLRATDEEGSYTSIFKRILEGELHGDLNVIGTPEHVTTRFHEVARGREIDQIYFIEVENNMKPLTEGAFFAVDNLPAEILDHYKEIIPQIIEAYQSYKKLI